MAVYPSREWIEAVLQAAERSEEYKEAAKEWEGDFLCKIDSDQEFLADMERKEVVEGFMSFLDMMPVEVRTKYKGTPMGDVLEDKLGISLDASMAGLDVDEVWRKMSGLQGRIPVFLGRFLARQCQKHDSRRSGRSRGRGFQAFREVRQLETAGLGTAGCRETHHEQQVEARG